MQQEQFEEFLQHFDPQSFFSFCVSGWSKFKKLRTCSFQNPRARCGTHTQMHIQIHTVVPALRRFGLVTCDTCTEIRSVLYIQRLRHERHCGEREREREKEEVAMQRLGVFSLPSSFVLGALVRPLPLSLSVPLDGPPDAAEDSTPEVKEGLIMIVQCSAAMRQ